MKLEQDEAVWCIVMFDLPVLTREQRTCANAFRNHLKDLGLSRVQLSVYCQYMPAMYMTRRTVDAIMRSLPPEGEVRILYVTDTQWAKALRFFNATPSAQEERPLQLTIF